MGLAEGNYIITYLKLDWSCHFYLQWRTKVYKSGISETLTCKFNPLKKLKFDFRISVLLKKHTGKKARQMIVSLSH